MMNEDAQRSETMSTMIAFPFLIENDDAQLVEGEEMAKFVEDQNERDGGKEEKHLFHR